MAFSLLFKNGDEKSFASVGGGKGKSLCRQGETCAARSVAGALALIVVGHHGKVRLAVQALYYYLHLLRLGEVDVANELLSIAVDELRIIEELSSAMERLGFSPVYNPLEQSAVMPLRRGCLLNDKTKRRTAKSLVLDVVASVTAHVRDCATLLDVIKQGELSELILQAIENENASVGRLRMLADSL